METPRLQKLNQTVKESLNEVFRQELQKNATSAIVTVTHASLTKDFTNATVYINVFPENLTKPIFEEITKYNIHFKKKLVKHLANKMHTMPKLHFKLDNSHKYVEEIDSLLKGKGENPIKDNN